MNLRARILGLITLSALTLFSCEEDISTIGLPPESNLGIFFADVPLADKTTQVWVDGVSTIGSGYILAGAYQDPNFGIVETKNYSEIGTSSTTFDAAASLDSVVLQLRVSAAYGNNIKNVEHRLEVYQLADSISAFQDGKLRSFTAETTEPIGQKLGDLEFQIFPDSLDLDFADTNIDLNDSIDDAVDSAFYAAHFDSNDKYIYLEKSRLDQSYGTAIFNKLRTNQYDSIGETAALFKGIHIRPMEINGAIVSFILDSHSGLVFYYSEDGENKSVRYPVSSTRSYNNISPNKSMGWSGSEFDDLSQFYTPYTSSNDKAYLMSGTNLLMKIDLAGIRNAMRDTVSNSIVQSAELVLSGLEPYGDLDPPTNIRFWLTSTDSLANENFRVAYPPNISNSSSVVATYNEDINGYKIEAPLFIESLFSSETYPYDQLMIGAVNSNAALPQSIIRRMVINKNNINLRYFYTIPDKDKK